MSVQFDGNWEREDRERHISRLVSFIARTGVKAGGEMSHLQVECLGQTTIKTRGTDQKKSLRLVL